MIKFIQYYKLVIDRSTTTLKNFQNLLLSKGS